jgi:hypothetical protein
MSNDLHPILMEEKIILDRPDRPIHFLRSRQGAALRSCDVMQLNLKKVKKNSKKYVGSRLVEPCPIRPCKKVGEDETLFGRQRSQRGQFVGV